MEIMTGQGKGAARDLMEEPDFAMQEASSPPQGQKRSGGSKAASEEKRTKASMEKRYKAAAKEKLAATPHFCLGFEAMEKLAIDEGSSLNPEPPNTKKGRSDKEAA